MSQRILNLTLVKSCSPFIETWFAIMYGIKLDGVWFDVGTPEELIKAQNHLVKEFKILPFGLTRGEYCFRLIENSSFL